MARYWLKCGFEPTPPVFAALVEGDPFEFCGELWHQKTRVPGLSYGIVCVILCVAVLAQYQRVTDGRTDKHMPTAYTVLS